MDKSNPNQTQLNFSCNAGSAAVNLFTGRMLFQHEDISIGANTYRLGVSHIFNSQMGEQSQCLNTYMGKGWKLNVHQYITSESGGQAYAYMDSMGYKHTLEYLRSGANFKEFYDTTGLGLTLKVTYNNANFDTVTSLVLYDNAENKLYFSTPCGALERTESFNNIRTYYNYDSSGKLIEIKDGETNAKYWIGLEYNADGLVQFIRAYTKENGVDRIVKTVCFDYENGNLISINEAVIGGCKVQTEFVYGSGSELQYAIGHDLSTLEFTYQNGYGAAARLMSKVRTGIRQADGDFLQKTSSQFIYSVYGDAKNPRITGVTNERGLKLNYYFNEKGFTTAVLEAHNGSDNDLRTLEKMPGVSMMVSGTDSESINKQKAHYGNADTDISTANVMEGALSVMKDYRLAKCYNYVNFICSFWLKLNQAMSISKINITLNSFKTGKSDVSELSTVTFDSSAVGSWQYISVPVRIQGENLNWIKMQFVDRSSEKTFKIADMRLCYSPLTRIRFTNAASWPNPNSSFPGGTQWASPDDISYIKYTPVGSNEQAATVNEDFYMSESDFQATYLSMFKERGTASSGNFVMSYCDGTKKKYVSSVTLRNSALNEDFPLNFQGGFYGNGRAKFMIETRSPDDDMFTFNLLHFQNISVGGAAMNCIKQITETNKFAKGADGHNESFIEMCVDLQGRIRKEVDEYKVETIYTYDALGNLSNKTVQHSDILEKLVFTTDTTETSIKKTDYASESEDKTHFNGPLGNINKVEYSGLNEVDNTLITDFTYDLFGQNVESVKNNIGGENIVNYNCCGRMTEVTPTGFSAANGYGFKFEYNSFGDPCRHYLTYMGGSGKVKDLLVEKDISYTDGTITTKQYRTVGNPDVTTVALDKYGRTASINESGKYTTFKRQDLWESAGACEVTEMYDPYESRSYKYSYDDFNNVTGYEIFNGQSTESDSKFFEIKRTDAKDIILYGDQKVSYNGYKGYYSAKLYDEDNLINPRVSETCGWLLQDFVNNRQSHSFRTNYSYDKLGRIIRKGSTSYTYKPNTLLKKTINKELSNIFGTVQLEYNLSYEYDSRGNVKEFSHKKKQGNTTVNETSSYTYDAGNRIETYTDTLGSRTRYTYNIDGSIDRESYARGRSRQYNYNKGRLIDYVTTWTDGSTSTTSFSYDNLGNCTGYKGTPLEWDRGSLLKKYGTKATYMYNNQGVRFRKQVDNNSTVYHHDGGKLIGEDLPDGRRIRYMYDAEEIIGFMLCKDGILGSVIYTEYCYVKDAMGNVIAITEGTNEVARYEYDEWGNYAIGNNTDGIADLNPIRWKSQYQDNESKFYYIGGRYYSPETRQYLSPLPPEAMMANAATIYALNPYLLTLTNPLSMAYNGYTIATNIELAYDAPNLSKWQQFWQGAFSWYNNLHWGWKIGVGAGLFLAGLGLTVLTHGAALPFIIKFGIGVAAGTAIGTGINLAMGADFGDALLDGFADSVLISGVFSFASGAIRAGKYGYAYATKNAEIMAKLFTHNSHAASYMLGQWDAGGPTGYIAQAKAGGHTYFEMSAKAYAKLSARMSVWEINKAFLIQQAGKTLFTSHSIELAVNTFLKELIFLGLR